MQFLKVDIVPINIIKKSLNKLLIIEKKIGKDKIKPVKFISSVKKKSIDSKEKTPESQSRKQEKFHRSTE